jgi:site-specific recombinase XerD
MAMITTTGPGKGFIEHFNKVIAYRTSERLSVFNYDVALKHLEIFSQGKAIQFSELSTNWFDLFKTYLSKATGLRSEKPLSHNSVNTYFRIVLLVAKDAADARLMDHQVLSGISNTRRKLCQNASLSLEELQRLARTRCRVPDLKKAFLFSCLTGLQWKEIAVLKWKHIKVVEGSWVVAVQRKDGDGHIPLNAQARELLGTQGKSTDSIFWLHYSAALCCNLNQWALRAGVLRKITFNTARLTFGQLLLDTHVSLELVSELMGHKNITTTQKLFHVQASSIETTKSYLRAFGI